jgi:putative serine protease PepD
MSIDERPALNTPPFGPEQRPDATEDSRIGAYTAADFPAPAGVPLVTEARPVTGAAKRRRGFGTVVATAALAAVVGAGAGVGAYATLVSERGPVAAPIRVSTVPASQAPQLEGTVQAAAAAIEPSVVTISVQGQSSSGVGSGVVVEA